MQLTVQPRVQVETWSLYWKQPSKTETRCLKSVSVDFDEDTTISNLMNKVATQMGWPPESSLVRLEGFEGPWQRALCRGRVLPAESTLTAAGLAEGDVVTLVRTQLVAEGWKITDEYSLTDSEDEDDA